MIPATSTFTQVDNLPGEETQFTVGDPRWVMQSMSDLYSDRETACVREYSTNAYDAAKERALRLGIDTPPIEVTLPSMMSPEFRVRDFGDGMSAQTLTQVYTAFGVSTKRDSNEFNGVLGFGSKSAVAYTNTFTVVSIHEGIKSVAVITRKPDWSIVMKVISQAKSNEPSGTEIIVPVHNHQEFAHKATQFYKFWLPGTVKVNGAEPEHAVGDKIVDGLYRSTHWNESYVVMGNVPYRIRNSSALFQNTKLSALKFVAYTDNGNVEFTPSREDLKYTDVTNNTLNDIVGEFEEKVVATAVAEIEACDTHADAYKVWRKWSSVLHYTTMGELTFKGIQFASDFAVKGRVYPISNYRSSSYDVGRWNVESMPKTLIVTEFDINLNTPQRRIIKEYIRQEGLTAINNVVFTRQKEADIECVWIERDNFVKWEDVKAALPKAVRAPRAVSGRIPGSFDILTKDGKFIGKELPEDDTNLFWVSSYTAKKNVGSLIKAIKMFNEDATVIILPANRWAKFHRENPQVEEFNGWAKKKLVDPVTLLSSDAMKVMMLPRHHQSWLSMFDESKIDDDELSGVIKLAKDSLNSDPSYVKYQDMVERYNVLGVYPPEHTMTSYDVLDNYPLLWTDPYRGPRRPIPDSYLYINAKYAANKD